MDTAASSSGFASTASHAGFAIPIDRALAIEKQIVAGTSSSTVHIGPTAWLGVEAGRGGRIAGVVSGSPAAAAGLRGGDVITAVAGKAVSDPGDIGAAILAEKPGATITITFADLSGPTQTVNVTLGTGPPQ
jgi:S1-C subfamily serine protease